MPRAMRLVTLFLAALAGVAAMRPDRSLELSSLETSNEKTTSSFPGHLKVIGAGLGRTGSESLGVALRALGLTTLHGGTEAIEDCALLRLLHTTDYGALKDWMGAQTRHVDALLDFPFARYWRELSEDNPGIKVILTIHPRGVQRWKESWDAMLRKIIHVPFPWPTPWGPYHASDLMGWGGIPSMTQPYEVWNQQVIDAVPKSRLLIFNVSDGWEPLCNFLGVPVPEGMPFPHKDWVSDPNSSKAHDYFSTYWNFRCRWKSYARSARRKQRRAAAAVGQ